ncbi:hypothetical protein ARAF_1946 [Arsenophonus endosymbiont of Aleurodicus floccissimus]|nr:hypothetical protein ARAF_1946 [Arsenophonus endosymbiont of Aleurodicus floccissimus]
MTFIQAHPQNISVDSTGSDKAEFMWDYYHKEQLLDNETDLDDDDWNEDDEQGIVFIYKR